MVVTVVAIATALEVKMVAVVGTDVVVEVDVSTVLLVIAVGVIMEKIYSNARGPTITIMVPSHTGAGVAPSDLFGQN